METADFLHTSLVSIQVACCPQLPPGQPRWWRAFSHMEEPFVRASTYQAQSRWHALMLNETGPALRKGGQAQADMIAPRTQASYCSPLRLRRVETRISKSRSMGPSHYGCEDMQEPQTSERSLLSLASAAQNTPDACGVHQLGADRTTQRSAWPSVRRAVL